MRFIRVAAAMLAVTLVPLVDSCQKNQQEAGKFERADNDTFNRKVSDLSSFRLANGITVYLQEERTNDQIAIEVLYPFGYMDEPKDRPQLSHMIEHLSIYCASGGFGQEESYKLVSQDRGMLDAETVGDFSHFDYVVLAKHLDEVLRAEAARMAGMKCSDDIMQREQKKVVGEIDQTLDNPKRSLVKFGMSALNQVLNQGETRVAVRGGANRISIDEAREFGAAHYTPDGMVMVLIGNFDKADVEARVHKYFDSIPAHAASPASAAARSGADPAPGATVRATWDLPASAMYFVAPGPYASYRERLILTMFGSFLNQFFNTAQDLYGGNQVIYSSNQAYRVDRVPFFIYAQPGVGRTMADIKPVLIKYLERAVTLLDDDQRVESIKGGMTSFMTSTMLKPNVPDYPLAHHQVIGQEALNVGMRHMLREGRSVDDFVAEVNAVTPQQFREVVKSRIAQARLVEVTFSPGS